MPVIRALGPDDAAAFRAVRIRALGDHPEAFGRSPEEVDSVEVLAARFRDDEHSDHDFMLGAFAGDDLVALTGCYRERALKQRHVAHLWGVYVTPEHRGTGLGRQIVQAAVERARTWDGLEQLWLDVTRTNAGARALYASCGFRSLGVKPRAIRVGPRYYDEELMGLDLRAPA